MLLDHPDLGALEGRREGEGCGAHVGLGEPRRLEQGPHRRRTEEAKRGIGPLGHVVFGERLDQSGDIAGVAHQSDHQERSRAGAPVLRVEDGAPDALLPRDVRQERRPRDVVQLRVVEAYREEVPQRDHRLPRDGG